MFLVCSDVWIKHGKYMVNIYNKNTETIDNDEHYDYITNTKYLVKNVKNNERRRNK